MTLKPGCDTCEHVADVRGIDLTQPTPEAVEAELREQLRDALVRLDEQTRMTDAADDAAERRLDQSIKWMKRAEAAEEALAELRRKVDGFGLEWIYEAQP